MSDDLNQRIHDAYTQYMHDPRKGPYDVDAFFTAVKPLIEGEQARALRIEGDRLNTRVARLKRVVVAASAVSFDDNEYVEALEDCERHDDVIFVEGQGYQ